MEEREAERGFHPAADLLPLLEGPEFDALVADVRAHGLREPIVLLDGVILDGRNRYRACRAAWIEPRFEQWTPRHEGDRPLAFVLSRNLVRRHLDESQRAMVAARAANLAAGVRGDYVTAASKEAAVSQREAAKTLNVSRSSVQRARKVIAEGTPELVEKVDRGLIPVSTASKLVVLPKAEQVKIATTEDPVRAARKAIEEPEMHRPAKPITGWSLEQVQVECEKIPTSEINDWVLSPAERTISHEQREQLVMAVRAAAQRLTSLGDQIEEVSLCALKSCRMARGKREKRAPGQKYCSPVCADRAGERSAWRRPTAVDVD
jgi:ParB-like chromosome segregation protein Spo0J